MVTADGLGQRKSIIDDAPDLASLRDRLAARVQPVIQRMPPVPSLKALLSSDGGWCPRDGSALLFDPWSPTAHRCPVCGEVARGERHDRHWAKLQHLWLAERAAHLAAVGVLGDDDRACARAEEILAAYEQLYFELPNRDNVLGPSHLFFSTYLESIWVLNYLAAGTLLRESGRLSEGLGGTIDRIVDECANVIGEFNEGFSNRQTWHAAALTAIAAWFGDDELARTAIEGRTGLLGHLADGFGEDGTWYEGENYHLFALRGLLTGLSWARALGADLLEDPAVAGHLRLALLAPARSALPDLTFPARKDSRFGVSLAQPMYLELWEVGRSMLVEEDGDLASWLAALYQRPAQPAATLESYLHEAGEPAPERRDRRDLSWWSLLAILPTLPDAPLYHPESHYLKSQGLAVLRLDDRYASLECVGHGGGHGHPDRLHLTLHARGVHWLPDFGTGSYVHRNLFWYRSTLAHNAPLLNGTSQPGNDAACEMFDVQGDWAWARGRFGECERTVVAGPEYVLDVMTYSGAEERLVDLPWHLTGEGAVETPGHWVPEEPASLPAEFVHDVERFIPDAPGSLLLHAAVDRESCRAHLVFDGELLRARGPGAPGSGEATFFVCRGRGRLVRMVTVLDLSSTGAIRGVRREGEVVEVLYSSPDRHTPLLGGWQIEMAGGGVVKLGGVVPADLKSEPLLRIERPDRAQGQALWIGSPPPLDGTRTGFDLAATLTLDTELQYRRSEEPYSGPDELSATAWLNWTEDELFLMVEVKKADVWFRPAGASPLGLDNEVEDIHSDGIQVYLAQGRDVLGFLIVPDSAGHGLRVLGAGGTQGDVSMVRGAWRETNEGYRITCGLLPPWTLDEREPEEFDLLVNEMRPGRQRRAGQLVWSGGNGWVYLRGDRQERGSFGVLNLTS